MTKETITHCRRKPAETFEVWQLSEPNFSRNIYMPLWVVELLSNGTLKLIKPTEYSNEPVLYKFNEANSTQVLKPGDRLLRDNSGKVFPVQFENYFKLYEDIKD